MIRIGEDELKSSANEQLLGVATELTREINDVFERSWLEPLLLIRNAIDDERLGVQEKIALLTLGLSNIPDIVALQITLDGADLPLLVTKDDFSQRLRDAGLDPLAVLRMPPDGSSRRSCRTGDLAAPDVIYIPETDDWLATIVLPLQGPAGRLRRHPVGADRSAPPARAHRRQPVRQDRRAHRGRRATGTRCSTRSGAISAAIAIVAEALGLLSSTSPLARRRALRAPGRRGDAGRLRVPAAVPLGGPGRAAGARRLSRGREDDAQPALVGRGRPRGGRAGCRGAGVRDQPADPGDRSGGGGGRRGQFRRPGGARRCASTTRSAIWRGA